MRHDGAASANQPCLRTFSANHKLPRLYRRNYNPTSREEMIACWDLKIVLGILVPVPHRALFRFLGT